MAKPNVMSKADMIKVLESEGYKIKKVEVTVRKTFELREETLKQFMALVDKKDLKVKDAVEEALSGYIKKG